MFVFIAGTNTTGQVAAIIVVDNISSAIPLATLPIILAVAGATNIISAFLAKDICCISKAFGSSNISFETILPLKL